MYSFLFDACDLCQKKTLKIAVSILLSTLLRHHHQKFLKMLCPYYGGHQSRSHKNHKLPVYNADSETAVKSNFLIHYMNKPNDSYNKNASNIEQTKTSLHATTTQILTTISTKRMPFTLPLLLKKKTSSYASASSAFVATNYLLSAPFISSQTPQNNSCHNFVFTSTYKPSIETFVNPVASNRYVNSVHLPKYCEFAAKLIFIFVLIIMQISFATADQGNKKLSKYNIFEFICA